MMPPSPTAPRTVPEGTVDARDGESLKKCNGANKHDNDFTRDDLLRKTPVAKSASPYASVELPNKLVFKCRVCTEGRVVFTRSDLERVLHG
ncbi:MAG: hypothetical protein JST84_32045 [Acidobacteria bacterium]|nr:hypothetical protein [Acidobacteriota bacterium]